MRKDSRLFTKDETKMHRKTYKCIFIAMCNHCVLNSLLMNLEKMCFIDEYNASSSLKDCSLYYTKMYIAINHKHMPVVWSKQKHQSTDGHVGTVGSSRHGIPLCVHLMHNNEKSSSFHAKEPYKRSMTLTMSTKHFIPLQRAESRDRTSWLPTSWQKLSLTPSLPEWQ